MEKTKFSSQRSTKDKYSCDCEDDPTTENVCTRPPKTRKTEGNCPCKKFYSRDPTSVIITEDFTNFDGFIALIIFLKAKNIKIELIVANYGFGNVGPSINNIYDLLAMFGDETTPVVAGSYFAPEEIAAGPNPTFDYRAGQTLPVQTPPGPYKFPQPTTQRVGQVAQGIYQNFVPPLWKELGSTLYGTVNMLVRNKNPCRRFQSTVADPPLNPYVPAEDRIKEVLARLDKQGKQAVIFNSGTHSDLAKYFTKYGPAYNSAIREIIIMGGGFFNFDNEDDKGSQLWAGNIFSSDIFALTPLPTDFLPQTPDPPPGYDIPLGEWAVKPQFHTMQEFNIFLDPSSAKVVFDFVQKYKIKTIVVPTDATDPLKIGDKFDILRCSPTPEGRFGYALIQGLKEFEGGAFGDVIRAWDILAAIVFLKDDVVEKTISGPVEVEQLGDIEELKKVACDDDDKNPFNVLQYNYKVGQTTIVGWPNPAPSTIEIVTKINGDEAFKEIIRYLNSSENSSCKQFNYYLGEIEPDCKC